MQHRLHRITQLSWGLLKDVLGPARYASDVLSWWPLAVVVLAGALAVVGISLPDHLRLSVAWWIAIFLGVTTVLFARCAYRSGSELNPEFPRHRVDFGNPMYVTPDDWGHLENDLILFDVDFTNREGRRVNLEIDLFWEWEPQEGWLIGPFRLRLNAVPRGDFKMLEEVLDVPPERTESRMAAFDVGPATGVRAGPWHDVVIEPGHRLFVRLIDRVSDAEIRLPLPVREIGSKQDAQEDDSEDDSEAVSEGPSPSP